MAIQLHHQTKSTEDRRVTGSQNQLSSLWCSYETEQGPPYKPSAVIIIKGSSSFSVQDGSQRVIFVNLFDAANKWFIKTQSTLIDRLLFYTFHKLVSTSHGLTIGSSSWKETCKKRRLNVQRYIITSAIRERAGLINLESYSSLRDFYGFHGKYICPYKYTPRLALNFAEMLYYATKFDNIETPLLEEILEMVKLISLFRSTNNNLQVFVPLIRLLPENERKRQAVEASNSRNIWWANWPKKPSATRIPERALLEILPTPMARVD